MVNFRNIHEGGEFIVQQVVVVDMAGIRINENLFGKGGADPHEHPAVDLAAGLNRVQDHAGIMNINNFVDFNLHGSDREFAHYLYLGVSYFQHDLFYHDLVTLEPVIWTRSHNFWD